MEPPALMPRPGALLPAVAVVALLGVSALRFVFADAPSVMLLAVIPIVMLGMMFGARGGLLAALYSSVVYLAWAASHDVEPLEYGHQPLAFFVLGSVTGFYAHGALGDYDLKRQALRRGLRRAMERGEIVMHYQPVVSAASGETVAVEALARWKQPRREPVQPAGFIPAAERDPDTIMELTLHTFGVAAAYAGERLDSGSILMAINLSPSALQAPELPRELERVLRHSPIAPERVLVEITETAFAEGEEGVVEGIAALKRMGVGMVVLDDFGVGHSSLARLAELPIDGLKIDRRLVSDLDRPQAEAVVRSVVELAHGLGLTVIAEGVEDESTQWELQGLGCDALQGFHVGRPMSAGDLEAWLDR